MFTYETKLQCYEIPLSFNTDNTEYKLPLWNTSSFIISTTKLIL